MCNISCARSASRIEPKRPFGLFAKSWFDFRSLTHADLSPTAKFHRRVPVGAGEDEAGGH